MLENLNYSLFTLINATPASSQGMITLATLTAKYLIAIVPLLIIVLWLWGATTQRQLALKVALALVSSMLISLILGYLFPHDRPFAAHVGYNFLPHAPDTSFPSDHGTAIFSFALAFLFWHRLWSGVVLLVIGCAIAWSRVYLGVHWPMDMVGGFLSGLVGCLVAQILWPLLGSALYQRLQKIYHFFFAIPIRKGWVRA